MGGSKRQIQHDILHHPPKCATGLAWESPVAGKAVLSLAGTLVDAGQTMLRECFKYMLVETSLWSTYFPGRSFLSRHAHECSAKQHRQHQRFEEGELLNRGLAISTVLNCADELGKCGKHLKDHDLFQRISAIKAVLLNPFKINSFNEIPEPPPFTAHVHCFLWVSGTHFDPMQGASCCETDSLGSKYPQTASCE